MQVSNILAAEGLDQLTDFASFPNLEQIGIILLIVAVIGLVVLGSMLKGVKSLSSAIAELSTRFQQFPAPPVAAPAPPVAALGQAPLQVPALPPGYTPPELAQPEPQIGLAAAPSPVPFAAVVAEPTAQAEPVPVAPASAEATAVPFAPTSQPVAVEAAAPIPAPEPAVGPRTPVTDRAHPPTPAAGRNALPKALNTAARREISLVGRALKILDELEQSETDPDKLFSLFALDNLMARMRRGSEAQMILAGRDPERAVREALSVSDVIRTASSQIEHYERIRISLDWDPMIRAYAVVPAAHMIAELLENATTFSPEGAAVEVGGSNHSGDVVLTISDTGVGMNPQELAAANRMMQAGGDPDDLTHGRLGVAVVARLADKLGAAVSFAPGQGSEGSGTTAIVRIPARLVDEHPVAIEPLADAPAEPTLPPQPKLEPSAATESPAPEDSFQPVRLEPATNTGLPRRGRAQPATTGTTGPAAGLVPPAATPATAAGGLAPTTGPPAPGAPGSTAPGTPSLDAAAAPGAVPKNAERVGPSRADAIVPLGARFSPLGASANPSASLPRHAADGGPMPTSAGTMAGEKPPPGPPAPGGPAPFAGAPAGAAQPAGHETQPEADSGRAAGSPGAGPGSSVPGGPAPSESGATPASPVRRRSAAGRTAHAKSFPPVPVAPGAAPPHTTAPPGVIRAAAPVDTNTSAPVYSPAGQASPGTPGAAAPAPSAPVPPALPKRAAGAPVPSGSPAPSPGAARPSGLAATPGGSFQPPAAGGTFRPPSGTAPSAMRPGPLQAAAQPVAAPTGTRAAASSTSFQPGGTMLPGGATGMAAAGMGGSIAGSAIALKASIQEEALAELAGINAYQPERTESKPASSLARRQTGQSALPAPAETPSGPPKARDADKIRNALSSFQLGTRRGRNDVRTSAGKR
ncbi:MAG: hypothetical protein LBK95_12990 [Bifidobacteriaceae bacterium]|jgi:hypothetical protein|nr:hypothetical protein [Bifidobacteriaceae bacterium]